MGVSQDGALALLYPWVVLHQVGVQERVLGDPILDPFEKPVGGEKVGVSRWAPGSQGWGVVLAYANKLMAGK